MEAKRCQRWKVFPDFKYLSPITNHNKTEREGGGPQKSVTLAPTSRYMTDGQYIMRKPLFSAEQQTSILKKTKHTDEGKQAGVSRTKHTDEDVLTRSREELTIDSFSLPYRDILSPSASREDHNAPLHALEIMDRFDSAGPIFGSHLCSSRPSELSFSSSVLEVQRLNPPLIPQLASTAVYPTYIPRSVYSSPGWTQLSIGGIKERDKGETKLSSNTGHSRGETMTHYNLNYWACAIPNASPPSPNRHSYDWDPNKEYQALLDYTYPLRAEQQISTWDSSELQDNCILQTDLQDSGIELEHLCSSTNLSGLNFSASDHRKTQQRSSLAAGHRSPDLPGFTTSLDDLTSSTPLSLNNSAGLSLDILVGSNDRDELNHYKTACHHYQHHATSSTSAAFIRSTSILPQSHSVGGEVDEEFFPLPEQLQELQLLSKQVRDVTAQLSQPVRASWESLEQGTTSIILPEKHKAEIKETQGVSQETEEGKYGMGREQSSATQTSCDTSVPELHLCKDVELLCGTCSTETLHFSKSISYQSAAGHRRTSGASVESVGKGELTQSSLREVEVLVKQLSHCLTLHGNQKSRQEDQEQNDSLMQHIQVFCSHLEHLIQQLYTVSEKMELLSAPTVDIDAVKSSLAEYQREVSSHRPLISCVLQTGQHLLSCINTMSPFLRDALLLIERQSGALQTHTEHFLLSILSAMDSLTQPSQVQKSREEEPHPVNVRDSTM